MDDDIFELYTFIIEWRDEIQAYRLPRIDGVSSCSFGVWRVFEVPCRWLRPSDKRYKQRKAGNDK